MATAGTAPATAPTSEFARLALAQVRESKTNPRRHFHALDELTASVKQHGVLTPLLVRPWGIDVTQHDAPAGAGSIYEIVAGARRYRAAKAAGLETIPARILALDDGQALEFQVIENLQREDVHPLDEALGYQQLLKAGKHDVAAIAAKLNKSESYVYQRMKLAALIPPAQKAFLEEEITAGHAVLIARLQPKDQKEALRVATDEFERCSVRELNEWIQRNVLLDLHSAPFPKDDAALVPKAGACTTCPKRTGFAPALFPDVKKKDTCTDPVCFQEKVNAFIERRAKEMEKNGQRVARLTSNWNSAGNLIGQTAYSRFDGKPARCSSAEEGIVVEGRDRGKSVTFCRDPKCKMHAKSAERGAFDETHQVYRSEGRAIERRRRLEMERRRRIFRAVAEKLPLDTADGDEIALLAWTTELLDHDHAKNLCEAMGWPVAKAQYGGRDYRGVLAREMRKVKAGEALDWCLLIASAAQDLFWGAYLHSIPKVQLLYRLATLARVNVPRISAGLKAEQEAKKKRPAKKVQTSAKGKPKGKRAA